MKMDVKHKTERENYIGISNKHERAAAHFTAIDNENHCITVTNLASLLHFIYNVIAHCVCVCVSIISMRTHLDDFLDWKIQCHCHQ